jgi:hypothetical protein
MEYKVFYLEPSYTIIEASSADEARELFMNGEWNDTHMDPDGSLTEPTCIILLGDDKSQADGFDDANKVDRDAFFADDEEYKAALKCENCGSDNLVIDEPSVSCRICGWSCLICVWGKSEYLI